MRQDTDWPSRDRVAHSFHCLRVHSYRLSSFVGRSSFSDRREAVTCVLILPVYSYHTGHGSSRYLRMSPEIF